MLVLFAVSLLAEGAQQGVTSELDLFDRSLVGLPGVAVQVSGDSLLEKDNLIDLKSLADQLRVKLRREGVPVFATSRDVPGLALFRVHIRCHTLSNGSYVYAIVVLVDQLIRLERDPKIHTLAPTWSGTGYGFVDNVDTDLKGKLLRKALSSTVDFSKSYRLANPGPKHAR